MSVSSFTFEQPVVHACEVCGWTTMPGLDLCVGCLDIREWSRVNRAFCDFLHRLIVPVRPPGEKPPVIAWPETTEPEPADAALELAGAAAD